jgi:hypothetical protein
MFEGQAITASAPTFTPITFTGIFLQSTACDLSCDAISLAFDGSVIASHSINDIASSADKRCSTLDVG